MITIKCDLSAVEEIIPGSQIELREGKKPNTWVWIIKGVENLKSFSPNAYDPELNMLLSRKAQSDWKNKEVELQKQANTDRIAAVKKLKKV